MVNKRPLRLKTGAITFAPGTTLPSADEGTPCQSPAVAGNAGCMAARLAAERRKGSATGNIVTEASLPRRSMNEGVSRH